MNEALKVERRAKRNQADLKALSGEPVWDDTKDATQLPKLLNWYSQQRDNADAKKFLITYCLRSNKPQTTIDHLNRLDYWHVGSYGWLARIVSLSPIAESLFSERLNNKIQDLLSISIRAPTSQVKKATTNVQQNIQSSAINYTAMCEEWIDTFIINGYRSDIDPFECFRKENVKLVHIKYVIDALTSKVLKEFKLAYSGEDPELVEGYSGFTRRQLKLLIEFVEKIINDAKRWHDTTKIVATGTRKVRVKKAKPPIKQVAKLQYLKEHGIFKSIKSTDIVGASQLWVFNIKTRMLGVYVCANPHGFSVKGSTILNYDTNASIMKKIRKPDLVLDKVLSGGKVVLRKLLSEIKAKDKPLSGRINKDTLLLRVV